MMTSRSARERLIPEPRNSTASKLLVLSLAATLGLTPADGFASLRADASATDHTSQTYSVIGTETHTLGKYSVSISTDGTTLVIVVNIDANADSAGYTELFVDSDSIEVVSAGVAAELTLDANGLVGLPDGSSVEPAVAGQWLASAVDVPAGVYAMLALAILKAPGECDDTVWAEVLTAAEARP